MLEQWQNQGKLWLLGKPVLVVYGQLVMEAQSFGNL